MTSDLKPTLQLIADGHHLTREQSRDAFEIIMRGDANEAQIGAFLMGLRMRGETVDEITGAVEVMRSKAISIKAPENAIDPVGTGGDAHGTYNISTTVAIVLAACGVPVAKHGGRAVSSKSGSADVLESLGINLELERPVIEEGLRTLNIGFFLATRHHNAMRHVAPTRAALDRPRRAALRFVARLVLPL